MSTDEFKDVEATIRDGRLFNQTLRAAWVEDLIGHKRPGTPIVDWRDGKVDWMPADEIEVPDTAQEHRA